MSIEISFGGTCRDLSKLPAQDADLRKFFMESIVPAVWEDFSKNVAMTKGSGDTTRARDLNLALSERDCSVSGNVTIRL